MTYPNYHMARSEAHRLLDKYKITSPPIDPQAIAEAEGIDVIYVNFKEEVSKQVSGLYDFKSSRILINKEIPVKRMVFTIAHELGHAIMHQDYAKSDGYRAMMRTNIHVDKPAVEKEADVFAANLLAPKHMLASYKSVAGVTELSNVFLVSSDVILNQNRYS